MVEWINLHVFPREKFGPILAKNKIFIKIFFDIEQYACKLFVEDILGRGLRMGKRALAVGAIHESPLQPGL